MALDDDVRILSAVQLFEGFSPDHLRLLAFGAERLQLPGASDLYHEGEAADAAFVVASGRIRLFREREGERAEVGLAGPGALLGEVALIAPTHWLTGAETLSDTVLLRLDRKHFRRILEEYPQLAVLLQRRIARELQAMIRQIEKLSPRFAG